MAQGSDFTNIDRVVALATSGIKNVTPADRAFFNEWIVEGLKQIGPTTSWISEPVTLYPTELSMRKPQDMYEPIDIALFDSAGGEIRYIFRGQSKRIHASPSNLINTGQYVPELGAVVDLSEDAYYFHLGSNGTNVAYAQLVYYKIPTDLEGNLIVSEKEIFALTCFIDYMMSKRNSEKQYVAMYWNMFKQAAKETRAELKLPHKMAMDETARSWNSMIKKIRFRNY